MSLSLRPAQTMDVSAVGAILSGFVDATPWLPRVHSRAQDLAHAEDLIARGWVTVAQDGCGVQGFAARHGAELHALYVAGPARGQGIGAGLLAYMQAQTPALALWTFQANTGAQRFYERHGFAEECRTAGAGNDEGLPDIRYLWQRKDI